MHVFIDADSILFKACCITDKKSEIRKNIKETFLEIDRECFMGTPFVALKGRGNYRFDVYKDYKSNRPPLDEKLKEKLNYAHTWVSENYNVTTADGMEADDLCSIWCWEALENEQEYVLAHIDKDLDQIPGAHYNYNKKEHYQVSAVDGYLKLIEQWISGDSADGIPGLPGYGKAKARKVMNGIPMERLERRVRALYRAKGFSKEYCQQMYDCVYMLQNWEELYAHNPSLRP